MLKDRPSLAFFALIATSLCAAVVLVALLIAGDVAGPRVAMNIPPHFFIRPQNLKLYRMLARLPLREQT